ncbi:MAG: nickel pincer cofactor biosynthesis protein LarC [Ignavibacteria bacterium]|nr:nickel pincer cofactor biosynthesis protein LarC [Ignavibacteria bacterium]
MKIAYLDTIAGISGDMTLGAFLSAGVSLDYLVSELKKLNITGYEVSARHIKRNGIAATKVDVVISEAPSHHRHLSAITTIIEQSTLGKTVQETAKKIFHEVAVAEATVHNSTIEKVHFHEVGAIDSIVDIVGTAICLGHMGIERVFSSPVKVGSGGTVNTQHGTMPIPTPATMEILKGYPIVLTEIPFELTTPTGAAIVKALSSGTLAFEQLSAQSIGYGAGTREIPAIPNLLRLIIGDLHQRYDRDEVVTIETNIDDMNPEILPYVIEKLVGAGAVDAFLIPIVMKKGRPANLLSVLVEQSRLDAILGILFRETSTLGVRIQHIERRKLPRTQREIQTSLGPVTAKSVVINGHERLIPEFEECKRIALEKNLPLMEVYRILENEFVR